MRSSEKASEVSNNIFTKIFLLFSLLIEVDDLNLIIFDV